MPTADQEKCSRRRHPRTASELESELEHVALAWAAHNQAHHATRGWSRTIAESALGALDPTRGATRYHRHDEAPGWARRRRPVALIGAYLFYTD
jgi:spore germination cell wall hydrolase CwlJ-like protein